MEIKSNMEEPNKPNPNGANANNSDPREQVMWDLYVANNLENASKCAKEAGYSEDHSRNITMQGWFKERLAKLKRKDMLSKAERNLDKTLDLITVNKEGLEDPQLLKIKIDVSKTIVTTLGKNEGYTTREELTGKDGKDLPSTVLVRFIGDDTTTDTN